MPPQNNGRDPVGAAPEGGKGVSAGTGARRHVDLSVEVGEVVRVDSADSSLSGGELDDVDVGVSAADAR